MAHQTLTDYPKDLQKKVTLLQHFRSYLEGDSKGKSGAEEDGLERKVENPVYVKKWMRTRHAIMFRLSNKIVQVWGIYIYIYILGKLPGPNRDHSIIREQRGDLREQEGRATDLSPDHSSGVYKYGDEQAS